MSHPTKPLVVDYDDALVRRFTLASMIWGAVGILVGVIIALQMAFPVVNLDLPWTTFGRLRPLHTNAVIFAFVGNMIFAGIYYSSMRLLKTSTVSKTLGAIHFWGWQAIIVGAAVTLPLGLTRGKEYAELIWPLNIAVAVVWVVFGINFALMIWKRREKSLYVAIWFYIATIITVALLYVVNHLSLPTSLVHSYPIFSGVQDALVQWWYGHNAVAFFLTTPVLGIMYYFIPKASGRPVYSYRLSVIHFWSLIFLYIWAGPHHLLNTALPSWLQGLGMVFSLMLWAPSWGGMLNGLLTLRGAWDKLRTDPVIKFMAAGVTFYGMATFEGPLLSIKSVNALGHYTDWIVGHVHVGALGWNGFMAAGMFYWLVPKLWGRKLHSEGLANIHFWTGMTGILFYAAALWVAGITQGLSLNQVTDKGDLANPSFIETVVEIIPMYVLRAVGGGLYLFGYLVMLYNLFATIRAGAPVNGRLEIAAEEPSHDDERAQGRFPAFINAPVLYSLGIIFFVGIWVLAKGAWMMFGLVGAAALTLGAIAHFEVSGATWQSWYDRLLKNAVPFAILSFIAVAIGGALQIIPTVILCRGTGTATTLEGVIQRPYKPLELAGRDIYIREGCYTCHSQMIRTIKPDILRYGAGKGYSKLGESIYDFPFQWGSKRTGPDLAHEGLLQSDLGWHYKHLMNPRIVSENSVMPSYPWLAADSVDRAPIVSKINVLRTLGVPYKDHEVTKDAIEMAYTDQAKEIIKGLDEKGLALNRKGFERFIALEEKNKQARLLAEAEGKPFTAEKFVPVAAEKITPDHEMVALLAYITCLGKNNEPIVVAPAKK